MQCDVRESANMWKCVKILKCSVWPLSGVFPPYGGAFISTSYSDTLILEAPANMYNQERILIQPRQETATGCLESIRTQSVSKTRPTNVTSQNTCSAHFRQMYVENMFHFQMATDQDQGFKVREIEFCGKGRPGSFPIIHYWLMWEFLSKVAFSC